MERTIMVIEDNPDDEALTMRALKKYGVANRIYVAHDGAEALAMLLEGHEPLPTVILLDLKLPKIDGLEVLRRLRDNERTKLIPVVILTSSKEETDLIAGYGLGANSYVRKPVDFEEFMEAAHQLGMYWLLINQPPPLPRSTS